MAAETRGSILRFGVFELDLKEGQLRKSGVRLKLRPQAVRVLELLASRSGELVTREELRQTIWPDGLVVDFDQGLNFCVRQIRTALSDDADTPRFLETVPRRGYRFLVPVERDPDSQSEPAEKSPRIPVAETEVSTECVAENSERSRNLAGHNIRRIASAAVGMFVFAGLLLLVINKRIAVEPATSRSGSIKPIASLAVLPLLNLSGDRSEEFFADGMTEALIARLSSTPNLRVIARTSVMHFKETQKRVREIAKELNVDAVIEGAVLRSNGRVRITVRLVRAGMDENVWSSVYDREANDVLGLQDELTQAIARQIEIRISGKEGSVRHGVRIVSAEVYDNYLKGRFHLNKDGQASVEQSVEYFEKAIAQDPAFAPAWSGLAAAYTLFGAASNAIAPVTENLPKADSAATKALELDPEMAEAHGVLGTIRWQQWRRGEAETEYRRAIDLDPNNAFSLEELGRLLVLLGSTQEGLALARRARDLDPIPVSRTVKLGWLLFQARQYDEAIRELNAVLSVDQDRVMALWYLGFVLIEKNQTGEAISVLERATQMSGRNPAQLGTLTNAYARGGRRRDAVEALNELLRLRRVRYVPAGVFVNAYIGLGDRDKAFVWLDQACRDRNEIASFAQSAQ